MRCMTFGMSDDPARGRESPITGEINRLSWEIGRLEAELAAERARREAAERNFAGFHRGYWEVAQILGDALGYPKFADDQRNFPGATAFDGVCVGEHVPESIAMEAAGKLRELAAELARREAAERERDDYARMYREDTEAIKAVKAIAAEMAKIVDSHRPGPAPARPAAIVEIGGELADMHAFEDYEDASRFAREHDGWIKVPDSFTWHPSGRPGEPGGSEATP